MGKQHNKVEKRIRRKDYLKRKAEGVKAQIALGKKSSTKKKAPAKTAKTVKADKPEAPPADEAVSQSVEASAEAPVKKAPTKKAAAKKAPAKKAPAKKVATKKAASKKAAPAAEEASGE